MTDQSNLRTPGTAASIIDGEPGAVIVGDASHPAPFLSACQKEKTGPVAAGPAPSRFRLPFKVQPSTSQGLIVIRDADHKPVAVLDEFNDDAAEFMVRACNLYAPIHPKEN